jgi:hypothetical protein
VPDRIRFLLDEHIPAAVAAGLRQKNIEVATVQELGRGGLSDSDQLDFALDDGWVLITFDSDFLSIARESIEHAGIVWSSERKYSIGQLVRALALIHAVLDMEAMKGHVEFL